MKFLIIILSSILVLSGETPTEITGDTTPLGPAGSVLTSQTELCIERSKELDTTWPVDSVVLDWNKNGLNEFTLDIQGIKCAGIVLINESPTDKWLGNTEFFIQADKPIVNVTVSSITPVDKRYHVICHELGHTLGLPHSKDDGSCMDISQWNEKP